MPKGIRKRIELLKPDDPMYGISRQDASPQGKAHWRVLIRRHRISYGARFYDEEFGDESKSLAIAREYRDILLERIPSVRTKSSQVDFVQLRTAVDDLKQIELLLRELSKMPIQRDPKEREYRVQLLKLTTKQRYRLKDRLNNMQHDQARYDRVLDAIDVLGIVLT